MDEKITVWGIHNTSDEESLLQNKVIAIGWHKMGDLSKINPDRESYYKAYVDFDNSNIDIVFFAIRKNEDLYS